MHVNYAPESIRFLMESLETILIKLIQSRETQCDLLHFRSHIIFIITVTIGANLENVDENEHRIQIQHTHAENVFF